MQIRAKKKAYYRSIFDQHKSYAEIAKIEHISRRDIHAIIKEEIARRQKYKQQEVSAQAYQLFSEGKTTIEVAVTINLPASKVTKLYIEYWKLRGLDRLNTIYKETNGKLWIILKLYKELIKKRRMSIEQVAKAVEIAIHNLPHMETLYKQVKDEAEKMQRTIQRLANDIRALEYKISILDKIAFASEQDCKRKHQEIQELIAEKDRIEKLIANILSDDNEGYSKLKQIAKENEVVLSENKKLISISFVALIQTLKDDPEMINVIHKMATTNDVEHKDGKNILIKYLELNKDRILNLGEKNYENLVEELTNNAINTVADYSLSNPTLSLPQSSSPTFPDLSTQSYIFRIEESDTHHNSTGDITE